MLQNIAQKLVTNNSVQNLSVSQTIVFIDSQVEDCQTLARGVIPGIEVVILNADRDGVSQISQVLRQKPQVTEVHIVSHGSPGCLYLGNTQLSLDTLDRYTQELQTWFDSSSFISYYPSSLLLYGCNVAAGDAGAEFIAQLRKITNAEIAASTTLIGNAVKGGNWNLEYQTGYIIKPLAFSEEVKHNYSGVLVDVTYNNTNAETATPGNSVTKTFTVAENLNISDVTFGLNANHTWRGDLEVVLTSPNGTQVTLINSDANDNFDHFDLLLQDGSGNIFRTGQNEDTAAPIYDLDLIAAPSNPFSAFDGESSDGQWSLTINNTNVSGRNRTLTYNSSQLNITGTPNVPTISGTVFIDYDNDGTQETGNTAVESGSAGITVTAYFSDGSTVSDTTDINGNYSIENTNGLAARIEFTDVPDGFVGSSLDNADTNTVASVFFNDGTNQTANFGIFNPYQYVTGDPTLITSCFLLGSFYNSTETALVSVLHSASGQNPTKTARATIGEVGSIYGLAYSKETGDLFAGAFQTRFSDVGPEGNAAIYRIDGTTGNVSTFIDLEDFFGTNIAGEYSHGDNQTQQDSIDGNIDWNADKDAFDAVGKVALGDVEISEDRQYVYTINLADRQVYKIQIGADNDSTATIDYTAGDTRTIETFDILNGVGGSLELGSRSTQADVLDDIRPFALAEKDGTIYVGMVDSAESTQLTTDLHAYVYSLDTATGTFTKVLDFALDYDRQNKTGFGVNQPADWSPWVDEFSDFTLTDENSNNKQWINETQPILSDIDFDSDGSMILGFRDRSADQVAGSTLDTDGNANELGGLYDIASGGELLRAAVSGNQWTIESGATDSNPATEFYDGDNFGTNTHQEIAQGGIVQIPGFTSVESTVLDPERINSGGIQGFDNSNGDETRGIELFLEGGLDKANGLGDLEYFGALDTTEIGDRIWDDTDADGIQDPGETGIANVNISLYDSSNTLVGTTTTDSNGNYYFNDGNVNLNGASGLEPYSDYEIRIDSSNFDSGEVLEGYNLSLANIGNKDEIDSDALDNSGTPTIFFTTGDFGENNFSYDAGFSTTGYDYGDAPDTSTTPGTGDYQTTSSDGGASHLIDNNLKLGSVIDPDDGTQHNTTATADDNDGTDDEDGITSLSTLDINDSSYTINLGTTNNTGGSAKLIGWIDFDQSGTFDSDEASITTVLDTATSATLTWNNSNGYSIPNDIISGTTYARFRLSTDFNSITSRNDIDNTTPIGLVNDGEVEDYQITIEGGTDYGDAPDDGTGGYQTITPNTNVTSHSIIEGLSIGNAVDDDDGTLQNSDATADDNDGVDDEDGITSFATLETDDSSYSITLDVTNTTGSNTTLIGWIDFDGSGTFDSDEAVSATVANNATSATLNWSIPSDITAGTTYARFRLSSDPDLTTSFATGALDDGEVEDYQLTITQVYDYGDAPDTSNTTTAGDYQTTTTSSGSDAPNHAIVNGLSLGSVIDADDGTQQNTGADADDSDGTDDEDGVTFTSTTINTDDINYSATVNVTNTESKNVTLVGWIDFDRSGTFDNDEAVSTSGILSGNQTLEWTSLPADITEGTTYARFRLSSDSDLTTSFATGALDDGEIEDYQLTIQGIDYGDAPDDGVSGNGAGDYQTTKDNGGAAHIIANGTYLGNGVDADNGTQQDGNANADDGDGSDDEDGVTFIDGTTISQPDSDNSYSVEVIVNAPTTVSTLAQDDFSTADTGGTTAYSGGTGNWVGEWGGYETNQGTTPDDTSSSSGNIRVNDTNDTLELTNDRRGADREVDLSSASGTVTIDFDYATIGTVPNNTDLLVQVSSDNRTSFTTLRTIDPGSGSDSVTIPAADIGSDTIIRFWVDTSDNSSLETGDGFAIDNVQITETTTSDTTLVGWIDFNRNGVFENSDEVVKKSTTDLVNPLVADGITVNTLTWTNFNDDIVNGGSTYARFRVSTDSDLDEDFSLGLLDDGEVEDYQLTIEGTDYGDAPDDGTSGYQTVTSNSNVTSHGIVSGLSIGDTVDEDSGTLQNSAATADDNDGSDDEDGVTFIDGIVISETDSDDSYSVEVIVNAPDDVTTTSIASDDFSSGGYSGGSGWGGNNWEEDENGDGTTDSPNSGAGNVRVSGSGSSGILEVTSEERFAQRTLTLPTIGSRETVTLSFDHQITGTGIDPSDNPLAIQISTDGGSNFIPVASISSSSTTSTSYSLDITDNIVSGGNAIIRFIMTNHNLANPGSDGYGIDNLEITKETPIDKTLVGWIDFDGSGSFDADEEQILSTSDSSLVTDGTTANTLTWTGFNGDTSLGDIYARFRLSTDALTENDATGSATNGEVEDYLLSIKNEVTGTGSSEVIDTTTTIKTTTGDDLIIAGAGQDTLTGAGGDDCFHFNQTSDGVDVITDFDATDGDKLDFSDFFATGGELEGITNPFGTYIEAVTFGSGVMIQIDVDPADTLFNKNLVLLKNDVDGIGVGDIDASDFIF